MSKRPPLENLATWPLRYVTPVELADYLECDRRTIVRMIDDGVLRAHRVGDKWRIPVGEALRAFPSVQTRRYTR